MTESRTLCINDARYFHRFEKVELPKDFNFLAWLDGQESFPKAYWQSRDQKREFAACGSLLTLSLPPDFQVGNDSPARFYGGHAFFPKETPKDPIWDTFPRSAFFLPEIELVREEGAVYAIVQSLNSPLKNRFSFLPTYFESKSSPLSSELHHPASEDWKEMIASALEKIQMESLSKVVLARRSTLEAATTFHPFELLSRMKAQNAIRFAIQFSGSQAFIGATPERLYRREGRQLQTEAVAGTIGREEPNELLLDDPKQRREFDFVKTSIETHLSPLCETLCCQETDGIIETPSVKHLHNPFVGTLKPGVHDHALLDALHPTAAMGGLPRKSALEHLLQIEPFERGWYASPFGIVSQQEAEFAAAIRSALVEKKRLHLFAGTGIVEGSNAEKEWEELRKKTSLWRGVLS